MAKLLSTFIIFVCLVCGSVALPSKRGACVVTCSPESGLFDGLGLPECPPGYVCHSTGCGAICSSSHSSSPRQRGFCAIQCSPRAGLYDELNLPDCPEQFYCSSTGCGAVCRPYIG